MEVRSRDVVRVAIGVVVAVLLVLAGAVGLPVVRVLRHGAMLEREISQQDAVFLRTLRETAITRQQQQQAAAQAAQQKQAQRPATVEKR